ncbi:MULTISPECIES: rhodanese-like domain-containing protein [Lacticaseibacillus]|uniref:Rhodanese-like domain-containing protein n=2 Tax=Lacticaseibacillus TaxID=2759736 RepID=A0ABW4CHV8_9LACO|nr:MULTISPECIES: rhodanese-like domain-containing protein [Lacticaseibacillus]
MTGFLLTLVGVFLIVWAANWFYIRIRKNRLKSVGGELTPEEFEAGMRKATIADLREKKDFDAGHILGARSLPASTIKQWMSELRKDLPVYLYDLTGTGSVSAAYRLKKAGFTQIYLLKGGYNAWSGKTKKKKGLEDKK